jgi:hypothetical protein
MMLHVKNARLNGRQLDAAGTMPWGMLAVSEQTTGESGTVPKARRSGLPSRFDGAILAWYTCG